MFLLSCEYKWATHLAKNSFIVYNKNIIEVGHGVDIDSSFRIFRFNITNESPKYLPVLVCIMYFIFIYTAVIYKIQKQK